MPQAKRLAAVLGAVTLLCGCATTAKPPQGRGQVDSPLTNDPDRVACLRAAHLPLQAEGQTTLQLGALPAGATIKFQPTAGAAEALQLQGGRSAQGAEVIGSALLYPHRAPAWELTAIENCLSVGVKEQKN
jgi:hypothetical protein